MNKGDSSARPHEILPDSLDYEIVGLRIEHEPVDASEPYLDLTLQHGSERRVLRFWSPQDLKMVYDGPAAGHGVTIVDISDRGMENIRVRVDDLESGGASLRFVARKVDDLGPSLH
jgi:hypothetical protein